MELFIFILVIGFLVFRFLIPYIKKENARLAREEATRREIERRQAADKLEKERQQAADKLEKERRQAAEQLGYERQILSACNESIVAFENIPKHLMTAEELLSIAENEFNDGVFSPFWDSIEKATRKLGDVDGNIQLIADRSNQYRHLSKSYLGKVPPFPVDTASAQRLSTASDTAGRLQKIVRIAQRNFHFATIYEQRKTNSILMEGFSSLGDAIYGVGERLNDSIASLGGQIGDLSSVMADHNDRLLESMADHNERMVDAIQDVSIAVSDASSTIKGADKAAQAAATERAARQESANRMLDNIQRHRVPPRHAEY